MDILNFFQGVQNPFLDGLFQSITMLGESNFYILVLAIVFWCVDKNFGYKLGLSVLSNAALNFGLKDIFHTARPIGLEGIRSLRTHTASGYSFPSGHTQGAANFWTSIMVRLNKRWMYVIGSTIIILIGISRLYLAVHWPVDVVFGIIFGVSWVFISNKIFDLVQQHNRYSYFLVLLIPNLIGLLAFNNFDYYKMSGVLISLMVGYIIENRYIHYEVKSTIAKQILKVVIGLIIILGIKILVKQVLSESIFSDYFRYFLMGIWVTVGAPFIFKKIGL